MAYIDFNSSNQIEDAKERLIKLNEEKSLRHSWTDEDEKEYNHLYNMIIQKKG